MGFDESIRHGAGKLFVKDYGDAEFSEISVDQSEDGMEFNYAGETKEVPSANYPGKVLRLLTGESASLKIGILDHDIDMIARAFGHDDGDVVDDAVGPPKTKTLEFGGARNLKDLSVKVECPQPADVTLNDILTLYRVTAKPEYNQAYKIGQERFIPVTFDALADVAGTEGTAGTLGSIVSEYS